MDRLNAAVAGNFHNALAAQGRSPEIPESADAYGWLIGSWELDICHHPVMDVTSRRVKGEAHFGWVLEGRAVQDVWLYPKPSQETPNPERFVTYGTTLRVWDPKIQAWQIFWANPAGNHYEKQIGRWSGKDVVQVGTRSDGTPMCWRFTEITPESFHWFGEALQADGKTWKLEIEFRARRMR